MTLLRTMWGWLNSYVKVLAVIPLYLGGLTVIFLAVDSLESQRAEGRCDLIGAFHDLYDVFDQASTKPESEALIAKIRADFDHDFPPLKDC